MDLLYLNSLEFMLQYFIASRRVGHELLLTGGQAGHCKGDLPLLLAGIGECGP